jgi:CheY-like chemotaxis protein
MFLEVAGYDVITAYDGLDAIEKIHESKPDLVLMDIMMPLIDGIEVVRQMKADDSIKHIPVIMLTAASKSDMVEKAMQAGAVDYIQKPFEPEQVQNVIQKTLMA